MDFSAFLRNVKVPAIVYRDDENMFVVYENHSAILRFNPITKNHNWQHVSGEMSVGTVLGLDECDFEKLCGMLKENDDVTRFNTAVTLYTGERMPVSLSANRIWADGVSFVQMLVYPVGDDMWGQSNAQAIVTALTIAVRAESMDEAIDEVIAFAGNYIGVSRAYIFESISEELTANTYEWCAPGIEPEIANLQALPKAEYTYDEIIAAGIAVTDDIRQLCEEDRAILEPQGIKSLALVPIFHNAVAYGYVGFDDCERHRKWTTEEIQLLQSLADFLASLFRRRDAERNVKYSLDILSLVASSTNAHVIVSDLYSRRVLFVNGTFAAAVRSSADSLLGRDGEEVVRAWTGESEDYRRFSELTGGKGNRRRQWEFENPVTGKWYLMHDSIIKWIGGRDALIQTATEITAQKEYEKVLRHVAATDRMTGLYNREWGMQLIQSILDGKAGAGERSLVFIDLDDLKLTNDRFGHEAGDRMILQSVSAIKRHIRKSDTFCRWGGDEFVLIFSAGAERADAVMRKIQAVLAETNSVSGEPFALSFSYGIADVVVGSGRQADDLVSEADARMYAHKTGKE